MKLTSRPPIDIDQLAKQHFDNMIQAKLVTLEPTAEAMLPAQPVELTSSDNLATSPTPPPAKKAKTSSSGGDQSQQNGSGSTVYTCDQCDKTFTKKSSITRHKYEHSGEKNNCKYLVTQPLLRSQLSHFQTPGLTNARTATRLSNTSTT